MNNDRAPIYEQLLEMAQQGRARFHVPGHKSGEGLDPYTQQSYRALMAIDMTEIPGLDDLHQPEGVIREAQTLAAACFGAEMTYFLVGGSTAGNLAMILTACERGDLLLMQRNVHKSAIHACMLAGCQVVFLDPRWDAESQLATGMSVARVREALRQYPQAKALFLTNPNYYGLGSDIGKIADAVHAHGIPLLVDEAHGAHYGFHPELPASAMSCGADAAVQSTHKMLTSLTMGAMLHVQGKLLDRELLKQRLGMVQSSSPSYPIMASLDLSRRLMHTQGADLIQAALSRIAEFHKQVQELGLPFEVLRLAPTVAYETIDPFKLVIRARSADAAISGFELLDLLEQQGCVAEMADPDHVVLALSLLTSEDELTRLIDALGEISASGLLQSEQSFDAKGERTQKAARSATLPQMTLDGVSGPITIRLPTSRNRLQEAECVTLTDAIGRQSAEMIIPYPPGIPVLYPGEYISASVAEYLGRLASLGCRFQGASDSSMRTLLVR